jgi:antitoxin component YwqK of YwqJK toxin-antitoxin module
MKKQDLRPYNEWGQRHGYWEEYHSNGKLWIKGNFVNGKAHGYFEWYYSNGQLDFKGNFVYGKKHGYCEKYYTNGVLPHKAYYDMGVEVDYIVNVEPDVTPKMFPIV